MSAGSPFVQEMLRLRRRLEDDSNHLEEHSVTVKHGRSLTAVVTTPSGARATIDEPIWFGGGDTGPNPAEALLGAVAASLGVTTCSTVFVSRRR
jgi:hypothetical protein